MFTEYFCCISVWDPGVILPRAHANLSYNVSVFSFPLQANLTPTTHSLS